MAVMIKCKMCGGDLALTEGSTIATCEYCGTQQTVPTQDNEKKLVQFERADRLRRSCEFDKAAGVYESIVADFRQEAEAYWGLVLCKYGIEYVDDPASGMKIPTCHRSSFESVMDDPNFEQTLENADAVSRKVYREEAKQIEEIRKGIVEVSAKEEPYDIFICYKETAEDGQRTVDSVLAQDIYSALTEKGYRVFFSRITLEDKLGQEYEPYIFAALNSAKVMLAIGTDYEHYNAVWVKNEWSRYLKLMEADKNKHLIPCFKGIDAYDMPKEFNKLQAQDLGKVGAVQDLIRGIEKLVKTSPAGNTVKGAGIDVAELLSRANEALQAKDWAVASKRYDLALVADSQCADAYIGKLMAEQKVTDRAQLAKTRKVLTRSSNYREALRYADEVTKQELIKYNKTVKKRSSMAKVCAAMVFILLVVVSVFVVRNMAQTKFDNTLAGFQNGSLSPWEAKELFASVDWYRQPDAEISYIITGITDSWEAAQKIAPEKLTLTKPMIAYLGDYRRKALLPIKELEFLEGVTDDDLLSTTASQSIFFEITNLTTVSLPSSVTVLPEKAFSGCTNLETVILPDGLTNISSNAFHNCTSLKSISVPNSVSVLPAGIFSGCTNLETVILPDSLINISPNAFQNCTNLKELSFPEGLLSISAEAFSGCTSLKNLSLPESLLTIEAGAFSNCTSLSSITLPEGLEIIDKKAFSNCTTLAEISIPTTTTKIGDNAFAGCSNLKSLTVPSNVSDLSGGVFSDCTSLTSVVLPDALDSIGSRAFENCINLTSVTIPTGVQSIGVRAFANCESLTAVSLPDTVTKIDSSAFTGCSNLNTITIPKSVKTIGMTVFTDCPNLKTIYCTEKSKPSGWVSGWTSGFRGTVKWGANK